MPKVRNKQTRKRSAFAEMLVSKRTEADLTQRDLANPDKGLSHSFIALLETDRRGKAEPTLTRGQVWYLIQKLEIWPPDSDRFLEAAGHEADRSAKEELDIQERFEFDELWVYARYILDPDDAWFEVVYNNIVGSRAIAYRYFTEDKTPFLNLVYRLSEAGVDETLLKSRLECTIVPPDFFISSFALYLKDKRPRYGCGTKLHEGRAEKFYAMHASEASRLFEMLRRWRDSLRREHDISLSPLRRIYPEPKQSKFVAE